MRPFAVLIAILCLPATLTQAQPVPVTVFAAASLQGALDDVGIALEETHTITVSYGGSGAMARQVALGAPADLLVLASSQWMDWLEDQGTWPFAAQYDLLRNQLVVVAPADTAPIDGIETLPARLGVARLAMGQRDAVPAGVYAQEWLKSAGLWDDLSSRLAETDNVRAALALVARKETPFGIVYATDAQAETAVDVVYAVPTDQHGAIVYPAAALTPAGQDLLTQLKHPEITAIFADHGFLPVTP